MVNIYIWISFFVCSTEVSQPTEEIIVQLGTVESSQFCQLCEEYASEALDYLSRNETQTEIISALHLVCSKVDYLKQQVCLLVPRSDKVIPVICRYVNFLSWFLFQCTTLVDRYVPLLLKEVENMDPDDFCDKVKLCKGDAKQSFSSVKGFILIVYISPLPMHI